MYASVEQVASVFDSGQWDPATGRPDTATVGAWLQAESDLLDGQIAHVVATPVDEATTPKLYAVVAEVVALRVRARVREQLWPTDDSLTVAKGWRDDAARLVKGIQGGAVADGAVQGGRTGDAVGSPSGYFGDGPTMTMGQQF
jgi:hypothetical protein